MPKFVVASTLFVITGAFAVFAAQQDSATKEKATPPATAKAESTEVHKSKDSTASKTADHMFASCIAAANQEEIILAELARTKSENEDVKKFAEMMITDHHTFLMKLKKFAPEATQSGFLGTETQVTRADATTSAEATPKVQQTAGRDAKDEEKDVNTSDTSKINSSGSHADHQSKFLQIEKELANQCLALSKEKLNEHSGHKFDACFLGQQIAMHMGMKAKLMVFQKHASSELASILAEGQKTTEEHLAKAESLMKQIDSDSSTTIEKTKEGKNKEKKVIKEKE